MAIKNFHNEKVTPKTYAQELIWDAMNRLDECYWVDSAAHDGMTEKEIEKVTEQLNKLTMRVKKMMGYTFD